MSTMNRQTFCNILFVIVGVLCFVQCYAVVSCQSVPVFLWSNSADIAGGDEPRFRTLIEQIEPKEILDSYTHHKTPVLAFVQKNLNIEQFTSNDAPFMQEVYTSPVSNPLFFANVRYPSDVVSSFSEDESKIGTTNVVVRLTGNTLKENSDAIMAFMRKYNSSSQPLVFMVTGDSNSLSSNKRPKRAAAENVAKDNEDYMLVVGDADPCLLIYTPKVELTLYKADSKDSDNAVTETYSKGTVKGTCKVNEDGSKQLEDGSLTVQYSKDDNQATLDVKWKFQYTTSFWEVTSISAVKKSGTSEVTFEPAINKDFFWTSNTLSWSCQKQSIALVSSDKSTAKLDMYQLQIQPVMNNKQIRFNDSSDCSVWFTLPIWSGLIVILILITILYSGVTALMAISTPDRFENPKGRGLIITNVEE